ncbi:MAG: Na/Pi cotransporter family protein [Phycisphaeraceae bacterium]|nr:Na/Pi cotransporter family protein [Phycisphaeraceae bacterium]
MMWTILGGVGLFLLGMSLMTEGLKAAAGGTLRAILERRVSSPGRGVFWGAVLTALVQSSSATTMTTIGFVSAGLLTFPQAVGVIFGANLGTTSTGWLVSLLGFKVSVGAFALPLVFAGAVMRLFGRGRLSQYGLAVAGFGLLFVGLATLQSGMSGLSERFSPSDLPQPTLFGRLALVGIGLAMTVVMQSSSAAVATTLTALHAGAIELDQAAALVIGQNIGSAVTSAIAAIGGSTAAKRTALSHVLFNVVAAAIAVGGLSVLTWGAEWVRAHAGEHGDSIAIAMFHTLFNLCGVVILLPLVGQFSRLIERMLPERRSSMLAHLDPRIRETPSVAPEAARRTLLEATAIIARECAGVLGGQRGVALRELDAAGHAVGEAAGFLTQTAGDGGGSHVASRVAVMHAIDHLGRWIETLREMPRGSGDGYAGDELRQLRAEAGVRMGEIQRWGMGEQGIDVEAIGRLSKGIANARTRTRAAILERTATGLASPTQASAWIEELKWLDRLMYHAWRATAHLQPVPVDGGAVNEAHSESMGGVDHST